MSYYVYLLVSSDNCTYVGATMDLDRRLRQHNKEIKGGARATGIKVEQGHTWTRACYVRGFFLIGRQHYNLNGDGNICLASYLRRCYPMIDV